MNLRHQVFRIFRRKFLLTFLVIYITSLCLLFNQLSFISVTSEKYYFLYNFEGKHGDIGDMHPNLNIGESNYIQNNLGIIPYNQVISGVAQRNTSGPNIQKRSKTLGGIVKELSSKDIDGIVKRLSKSIHIVKQRNKNIDGVLQKRSEHDAILRNKPVDYRQSDKNNKIKRIDDTSSDPNPKRDLTRDSPWSLETEMAKRKLISDEQELWYFIAAQLEFHRGHWITKLDSVKEVAISLHDYQRLLNKDLTLYEAALNDEQHAPEKKVLEVLDRFKRCLTDLLGFIFRELDALPRRNTSIEHMVPEKSKREIKYKHTAIRALTMRLVNYTDNLSNWKYEESMRLGEIIRRNIQKLQNPEDCSTTLKLLCGQCSALKDCGFACTVHHVSLCLIAAYLSNRTMVFDCKGWKYSERGWNTAFLPINTKCTSAQSGNGTKLFTKAEHIHILLDTSIEVIEMRMPVRMIPPSVIHPPMMPNDLKEKLIRFNTHPPSWWMGQFKAWALRFNDDLSGEVNLHVDTLGVKGPIVGMHVRRTDKTSEAKYHILDEYMVYAEEWFDAYEYIHKEIVRKIYLATDEPRLLAEARYKYPEYKFIHDINISSTANLKSRYSESSLRGLLKDLYSLLQCDYVVCTFSSTFCRLVYEVMQTQHGDVKHKFQSLDDIYFVPGQSQRIGQALQDHQKRRNTEISFNTGDIIEMHGNHWDGFSFGNKNHRKRGLYPSYKVDTIFETYNYSSKTS